MEPVFDAANWSAFDEVYQRFARAYPMLGLTGTRWGAVHTRRKHGAALLAVDAARRSASGRWIAHVDRFPQVMFDLLTTGPNRLLDAAAARGATTL
jgi:hypothetical protein